MDARASYGIGLETFALGFPVHLDWSWRTLLNKDWKTCGLRHSAAAAPEAEVLALDWLRFQPRSAQSWPQRSQGHKVILVIFVSALMTDSSSPSWLSSAARRSAS